MNSSRGTKFSTAYGLLGMAFVLVLLSSPIVYGSGTTAITKMNTNYAAGYIGSVVSGDISKLTVNFVVPTVACQSSLPEAQTVGVVVTLAGVSGLSFLLNQNTICDQGSSSPRYVALFTVCSTSCNGNGFPLTLTSGDKLSYLLAINLVTNKVVATLTDVTTGQKASYSVVQPGANTMTTAYWFVEGGQALTQFVHPITFSNCHIVVGGVKEPISSLTGLSQYNLVDGSNNLMAKTSALSASGTSFKVTFVSST